MKKTKVLFVALAATAFASSQAQIAQCLFAQVTNHSYMTSWVGTIPGVYITDGTDGTNRITQTMEVAGGFDPMGGNHQYFAVTQSFAGYVRVQWIGEGTPDPTIAYEGRFHVWGLRRVYARIVFLKANPPRNVVIDATITATHIPIPSTVHISSSTPPRPFVPAEGLIGLPTAGQALGAALPTITDPGEWTYMGQIVTGGVFIQDGNGDYYADMDLSDGSIHYADYQLTGMYGGGDVYHSDTISRVTYELYEVGGQPVVP